jgi:FtsH-binding integral membrane protein
MFLRLSHNTKFEVHSLYEFLTCGLQVLWIASHHSLNVFTYADFLNLFSVHSF